MEQFGLSAEEEYYSFDEHLTYVKRRIFILIQKITIISKQMTLFQQNNNQYQQHQQQKQEQDDGKKKLSLLKGGLNKFYLFIPPHRIYHIIPTPENDAHYVNFILGLLMSIARVTGLQFQLIDEFTELFLRVSVSAQFAYHKIVIAKELIILLDCHLIISLYRNYLGYSIFDQQLYWISEKEQQILKDFCTLQQLFQEHKYTDFVQQQFEVLIKILLLNLQIENSFKIQYSKQKN